MIRLLLHFIAVLTLTSAAIGQTLVSEGKPVTSSSVQIPNYATNANDGSLTSRWAAADGTYPQWWRVDLVSTQTITKASINWYSSTNRAYKYRIEISNDDVNYSTLVDNTNNTTFADTTNTFLAGARFVRVYLTGTTAAGGFGSFLECQIFATNAIAPPAAPTGLAATGGNGVVNLNWT